MKFFGNDGQRDFILYRRRAYQMSEDLKSAVNDFYNKVEQLKGYL